MNRRGYFYIATGKRYRAELELSLAQLRRCSRLPVCIASDIPPVAPCEYFIPISNPKFSFEDKVLLLDKSPFQETVYLDTDISIFHSPDALFDGLDGADFLASHEASLGLGPASQHAQITDVFPELSSGLMVYRRTPAVDELLQNWRSDYAAMLATHGIREDQPALRRALFRTAVKFSILPPEFHYIPANFMRVVGSKIYCVHNHSFSTARTIGLALNSRKIGDYAGYVDGLGVFRNPYAMQWSELLPFTWRCMQLLPFLFVRATYIALKERWQKSRR